MSRIMRVVEPHLYDQLMKIYMQEQLTKHLTQAPICETKVQNVEVPETQVQSVEIPENKVQNVEIPENKVQRVEIPENKVENFDIPENKAPAQNEIQEHNVPPQYVKPKTVENSWIHFEIPPPKKRKYKTVNKRRK